MKVLQTKQWQILVFKQSDYQKLLGQSRQGVVLLHLETVSKHAIQLLEHLLLDWRVCVFVDSLNPMQAKLLWEHPIADLLTRDLPAIAIIKKLTVIVELGTLTRFSEPQHLGNVSFYLAEGKLKTNDSEVHLSKLECELVSCLLKHQNRFIDRSNLLTTVWPVGVFASNDALDVLIRRVRFKLSKVGVLVVVKRGFGYQLQVMAEKK